MIALTHAILSWMPMSAEMLARDLLDARLRLLSLVEDLADEQLLVPQQRTVNPILWEIGHVAWFQERWCVRERAQVASLRQDADELYDSAAVLHDTRWSLRLPERSATLDYMARVLDASVTIQRASDGDPRATYLTRLATLHEDMHGEALVYTRRTLGYAPPRVVGTGVPGGGSLAGDAAIPGGLFRLGSEPGSEFTFDNEMWAHEWRVEPFRIARAATTQAEFALFVDDGGYERDDLWSEAGRAWKRAGKARQPLHWRRDGGLWMRRHYDRLVALEPDVAVLHVNAFEADAYCAWAGRRLPTELEWEVAACGIPDVNGRLSAEKRAFPWGDETPTPDRAHLDLRANEPCDVGAYAYGDSAFGCRQMLGNVWEWCADEFRPYPGFAAGPYREYSEPWFSGHRVLRGGSFATRSRLASPTYRNFYTPDRRDVLAGFRTCVRHA